MGNNKKKPENRDFKGVWIPKEIYLNEDLNWTEKILLIEIDSLDNEKGCYATNQYFADFIGKSKNWVSQCISKLKKEGYIYQEEFNGRKRILKSNLHYSTDSKADFDYSQRGGLSKVKGSLKEKSKGGNPENTSSDKDKDQKNSSINTYNNTISNTIKKEEEEEGKLSTEKFSKKTLSLFNQVFDHQIKSFELQLLNKYDLPDEVIRKGIELSGTHNAQSLQYLLDILKEWSNRGITTIEGAERYIRQFKGEETNEDLEAKGYR